MLHAIIELPNQMRDGIILHNARRTEPAFECGGYKSSFPLGRDVRVTTKLYKYKLIRYVGTEIHQYIVMTNERMIPGTLTPRSRKEAKVYPISVRIDPYTNDAADTSYVPARTRFYLFPIPISEMMNDYGLDETLGGGCTPIPGQDFTIFRLAELGCADPDGLTYPGSTRTLTQLDASVVGGLLPLVAYGSCEQINDELDNFFTDDEDRGLVNSLDTTTRLKNYIGDFFTCKEDDQFLLWLADGAHRSSDFNRIIANSANELKCLHWFVDTDKLVELEIRRKAKAVVVSGESLSTTLCYGDECDESITSIMDDVIGSAYLDGITDIDFDFTVNPLVDRNRKSPFKVNTFWGKSLTNRNDYTSSLQSQLSYLLVGQGCDFTTAKASKTYLDELWLLDVKTNRSYYIDLVWWSITSAFLINRLAIKTIGDPEAFRNYCYMVNSPLARNASRGLGDTSF